MPFGSLLPISRQQAAEAQDVLQWLAGLGTANRASGPGSVTDAASDLSATRFQTLVEQIPAVTFSARLDLGLREIYVSPQIEFLLGYTQAEWVADPVLWFERLLPEDRFLLTEAFTEGCHRGGPFRAECRFRRRDGEVVWVLGEAKLITNALGIPCLLQGVAFDISPIKRAQKLAEDALAEKETLLREIHHRVKNNFQVTSALLQMQARRLTDASAIAALHESESRVRAMALVHEGLYRSESLASVDLSDYVRRLIHQIQQLYRRSGIRIETQLDEVAVSLDKALPCGLLVHELLVNSYKHAFADRDQGVITVEVRNLGDRCEVCVRDDGDRITKIEAETLGMILIRTLARQLAAELHVDNVPGFSTRFEFATGDPP